LLQLAFATFNGLAAGMAVFLVAAGVTLIFGILKVLNFAHGAFFMVGAYVAFSLIGDSTPSIAMLFLGALAGGLVVGVLGYITDKVMLQKLRDADYHYVLIATFALLLVVSGAVKLIWGLDYHSVSPPDSLADTVKVGGILIPMFSLFIIAVGLVVYIALEIAVHRMWIGKLLQSLVRDPWMINLFGYNVSILYTATVVVACFLAGAAGGLLLPNQSLSPHLGDTYILLGFVTCILGGLGSVRGAFIASLMLGLVESISTVVLNAFPGLTVYIAMVLVLLIRPQGFFGFVDAVPSASKWTSGMSFSRSSAALRAVRSHLQERTVAIKSALTEADRRFTDHKMSPATPFVAAIAIIFVFSMPLWANPGLVFIAGLTLTEAIFALSWYFLFSAAGVVSFGHAAFFALGAYGVGVLLKMNSGIPFLALLALSAIGGALIAAVVGLIALKRSSGIYLAILTMALAEICRIVVGYSALLGRDDGLPAIPRPKIDFGIGVLNLAPDLNYYWFLCIATLVLTGVMWWLTHSRFGRVLRSVHQDSERTAFIGVDVDWYRLKAFMISGALAALSGGLSAPWTQIVTPEATNVIHSTAPVLNALLGGLASFWGPFVGAVVFAAVNYFTRTLAGLSEIVIGGILLVIVLVAPLGIIGLFQNLEARFRKPAAAKGE
jgi:branched-chain amino acid transport system permease protein